MFDKVYKLPLAVAGRTEAGATVTVNGATAPVQPDGTFENLGGSAAGWGQASSLLMARDAAGNVTTRTASVSLVKTTIIRMQIGTLYALVNAESKRLASAPVIRNGSTLVPLRFIAETLGITPSWDPCLQHRGHERRRTTRSDFRLERGTQASMGSASPWMLHPSSSAASQWSPCGLSRRWRRCPVGCNHPYGDRHLPERVLVHARRYLDHSAKNCRRPCARCAPGWSGWRSGLREAQQPSMRRSSRQPRRTPQGPTLPTISHSALASTRASLSWRFASAMTRHICLRLSWRAGVVVNGLQVMSARFSKINDNPDIELYVYLTEVLAELRRARHGGHRSQCRGLVNPERTQRGAATACGWVSCGITSSMARSGPTCIRSCRQRSRA